MSPIARFKWLATLAATDARSAVLRVAIVLGYRLNVKTLQLNPSIKTIATDTGLTARSVYRALDYLERRGWLHRERGDSDYRGRKLTPGRAQRAILRRRGS